VCGGVPEQLTVGPAPPAPGSAPARRAFAGSGFVGHRGSHPDHLGILRVTAQKQKSMVVTYAMNSFTIIASTMLGRTWGLWVIRSRICTEISMKLQIGCPALDVRLVMAVRPE
jgi:hypothetical protein